ncbi:MAG: hypothetical protein E6R07_11405 [Nevskiaceae bacterium]|nr:MAG: hypothetical protein E6R07_11405 [Nevskiaceae bacterium]
MTLACSLFNLLVTLSVIWGWTINREALFRPLPQAGVIAPMVALTVLLATLAMGGIALAQTAERGRLLRYARWLSGAVIAIAVVALLEYLQSGPGGLESLLYFDRIKAAARPGLSAPGRLSPQTACALVLFGMALFAMSRPRGLKSRSGGWLAAFGLVVPGLALIGHFIKAPVFYTLAGLSSMGTGMPTAILLLVLGIGTLALADPQPHRPANPAGP